MNDEWEETGNEAVEAYLRQLAGLCAERLKNTKKSLSIAAEIPTQHLPNKSLWRHRLFC
jgi:hypothetical protein